MAAGSFQLFVASGTRDWLLSAYLDGVIRVSDEIQMQEEAVKPDHLACSHQACNGIIISPAIQQARLLLKAVLGYLIARISVIDVAA